MAHRTHGSRQTVEVNEERRSSPRIPVPRLFVMGEVSDTAASVSEPPSDTRRWTAAGVDLSGAGLALTLPDTIQVGEEVLLTFELDGRASFARVPARVVRQDRGFGTGAVAFHDWNDSQRTALLAFLEKKVTPPHDRRKK